MLYHDLEEKDQQMGQSAETIDRLERDREDLLREIDHLREKEEQEGEILELEF